MHVSSKNGTDGFIGAAGNLERDGKTGLSHSCSLFNNVLRGGNSEFE
jgi:hypothetical protein